MLLKKHYVLVGSTVNLKKLTKKDYKKAVFYYGKSKELAHVDRSKLSELRDYVWLCDHISNDFNALTQHVMGTMKSIEYKKDIPFDVNKFINSATNQKDYSQQNKNTQV